MWTCWKWLLFGPIFLLDSIPINSEEHATTTSFDEYQKQQIKQTLPSLPLQLKVYGSIFQTAYYFVDVNIGAPDPQSLSMIIDTGSSTQGIPCHDCAACGHSHWDPYYNRSQSDYNEPMPCGECSTCRLNADNDAFESLLPALSLFVDDHDRFSSESAHLLLNDPDKMQCLYHVHYAEGSSLSGLFYTDVVWLNHKNSTQNAEADIDSDPNHVVCPNSPSLPVLIPLGCHLEETHLFYDQKASGILGLEFWGTKGVPTFPTAVLKNLEHLYTDPTMNVVTCSDNNNSTALDKFEFAFALCLSPKGGVMSFGNTNREYHALNYAVALQDARVQDFEVPLISHVPKSQSYLLGLASIQITNQNILAKEINTPGFFHQINDSSMWTDVPIHPSGKVVFDGKDIGIIPTLLDSGTTLTYLPSRLFTELLYLIESRVAVNSGSGATTSERTFRRRQMKRVAPEKLFAAAGHKVIIRDSFDSEKVLQGDVVEFVPVTNAPLSMGPKRLVRLSSIALSPGFRYMRNRVVEELEKKLSPRAKGRRLEDAVPGWYAVLEPTPDPKSPTQDTLIGFLDVPLAMEGAIPRALASKVDNYNNGECWWLQDTDKEIAYFPMLSFKFFNNVTTVWHPLSYLYKGTNEHFWCLAMMTDGVASSSYNDNEERLDDEIIFGSNSFVHHDITFRINNNTYKPEEEEETHSTKAAVSEVSNSKLREFLIQPESTIVMVPANCPENEIANRS